MTVCKFFLSGTCKFGAKCRFEHPGNRQQAREPNAPTNNFSGQPGAGNNRNTQQNRFSSLDNRIDSPSGNTRFGGGSGFQSQQGHQGNQSSRGRGFQGFQGPGGRRNVPRQSNKFNIFAEDIIEDLKERPQWIMSCYGPGKNPPVNLWGGDIEQSPEEIRTLHYISLANGNPQASAELESNMASLANQAFQAAVDNPEAAIDYIIAGEQQKPNRYDATHFERHKYPLFSVDNYHKRRGVFAHIPRDNQNRNNHSQNNFQGNAFQANQQQGSGFGTGSGFGQQNGPSFGQAQLNGIGQTQTQNAFSGAPSGPAFGQPAFGQPAFGQSAFGSVGSNQQPQQGGFGQPQQGGFGQPQPGAFGQSGSPAAFGGQQQMQSANGGFGQGQDMSMDQPMSPPRFPNNQQSAFGGPLPPSTTPQPGAFGAPIPGFGAQNNGFSSNTQPQQQQNQLQAGGFGMQPQQPQGNQVNGAPNGVQPNQGPINGTGSHVAPGSEADTAYQYLMQHGQFKDGIVPETAPDDRYLVL